MAESIVDERELKFGPINERVFNELRAAGLDPELSPERPLYMAALNKDRRTAESLLTQGADPHVVIPMLEAHDNPASAEWLRETHRVQMVRVLNQMLDAGASDHRPDTTDAPRENDDPPPEFGM